MSYKPKILIVEDTPQILKNIKIILELNNYNPLIAENGIEALKILSNDIPDIILSDIMMPDMDGYELFKKVSKNPKWNQIPFIFVTAKTSIEDIRFGKMLGTDDYITKPFEEEDLLSVISGKLKRKEIIESINLDINKKIPPSLIDNDSDNLITLLFVMWDENLGPEAKKIFPVENKMPISANSLGVQLFQSTVSIYGYSDYSEADLYLDIRNISQKGYLFFDSIEDKDVRGNRRQYMLSVISPNLTYFESFHIKSILKEISQQIKDGLDWNVKEYHNKITNVLYDLRKSSNSIN